MDRQRDCKYFWAHISEDLRIGDRGWLTPSCFCALSQQELRGEERRSKEDGSCHKAAWPR